ncbi:hypothetical protein CRUP_037290 [Coryphaenoides rupestris]|nr:hypothetical protein CRUP_037290 [Coryphaenoides rupestris]
MRTVLMVAEKPSLAQSIAKILSKGSCSSRKGLNGACSVHDYTGSFLGQPVRYKMTSVCGHVLSLDFTGHYNSWDKVDPAELFSQAPTEKKEANPKLNMVKFLQVEARGCDFVVLWLDCDKEGENICFEVLDAIEPVMNKPSGREQTVYRAKFSSITDTDIWKAMSQLGAPDRNQALAVDARQELDLRIGCAFTRFQTKYFQGKYGNLDSSLISFGPCQTPTLGFCVLNGKDGPLTLDWDRVRVFDREVESVSKKEKAKQRPQALNTVEMLRVASSSLGMGPQHTMQLAERLYTQGYISYPRTETTQYHETFDLQGTLRQQIYNPMWAEEAKALLATGLNRPRKGSDAGDHPPITPMRAGSEAELREDCKYLQTTITFSIATEGFSCSGKTLISPGYTAVMPWQGVPLEEALPACERGDVFGVEEVRLLEKADQPPRLPDGGGNSITLMEKHGIDAELVLPTIRSAVEQQLSLISQGRADYQQVLQHTLDIFRRKFHYFVDSIGSMDELMEVSFSPLADTGKPLSRCGTVSSLHEAKPSRLHCSHCDETYSVPQNGVLKLYKELRCPLDDFELVLWTSGSRGKSYPLCPYCCSHPPFRDMKKGEGSVGHGSQPAQEGF